MRLKPMLRTTRPAHVAAGVLMSAIPTSAVALSAGTADAQNAIQASVGARHIAYGGQVRITGNASASNAGQSVVLEFEPAGSSSWRALTASKVRPDGSFRLAAPLRHSGLVKVVGAGTLGARSATQVGTSGATAISPSPARPVSVASALRVARRSRDVLGGSSVNVSGTLLPAVGRRQVVLQARTGRHWHTLAWARTGSRGGFQLHWSPGGPGQQQLRVRFRGDRLNTPVSAGAGVLTAYRQSLASWYDDSGSTACGFHAYYGVANKALPCGTNVTFHYGGHTVTAVVDDRGPYVGGREWDLNQNTAGALGFGGVDTVWSSI
jgi:rare lipoprotein A